MLTTMGVCWVVSIRYYVCGWVYGYGYGGSLTLTMGTGGYVLIWSWYTVDLCIGPYKGPNMLLLHCMVVW